MKLLVLGCIFRTAPLDLRERVAFSESKLNSTLEELSVRYGCEAVIIGTCNRVELYAARPGESDLLDTDLLTEFLSQTHGLAVGQLKPHLYAHRDDAAVHHLFRVTASLDSLIIGEAQIAGQVKRAYELAKMRNTPGVGLGLNLVSAIAKLHGFRLVIHPGPGGRVEIVCPDDEGHRGVGQQEVSGLTAAPR